MSAAVSGRVIASSRGRVSASNRSLSRSRARVLLYKDDPAELRAMLRGAMCGSKAASVVSRKASDIPTYHPNTKRTSAADQLHVFASTHTDGPVLELLFCVCVSGGVRIGSSWWKHCRCDFVTMS